VIEEVQDSYNNALREASDNEYLEVVKYLIEQGADIAFIKNLKIKEELGLPKWTKKPNNMEFRMNNICSISHEKLDENVKQLGCSLCKNVFKLDTLEHWLNINYKCPNCNSSYGVFYLV